MLVQDPPLPGTATIAVPPVTPVSLGQLFAKNALIGGIRPDVFDQIFPLIQAVTLGPDEVIFAENDPGDSLYLIAQGSVKISKRGRGGQQETLAHLMEQDFFGEMALVDSGRRSAQASAIGQTVLGRIDHEGWDRLLHLAPHEVLSNFIRAITRRLRHNNQHFIEEVMRSERLSLLGTTMSCVVHDMNNPINTILNACHVIQKNIHDELTDQMSEFIRDAVERMQMMTREIVDFSRGETELKLQSVAINNLLRSLEPEFAKCRPFIDVKVEVLYDGTIQADRHRLIRVFSNLIRNAREAMKGKEGNSLRFVIKQVGPMLRFEFSDTGCGIPSDVLPSVFEPFVTHGKTGGTGLGLAVSKAVVEAHQGTISVQSSENGTSFQIDLPLRT